eukprot:CAMPEP_0178960542 /NCGR_PEP_ID=MMETSP0789-20121207/13028_1 /TAXON_ID=3005 /ORGANISM="Rhizosolenia setigera, Strain CCMP 1694" /LENGTH=335 /DNA_ID=CAMNT_0020643915 /DNA_START=91 /DNA_END=1098 /DNA_ORIENTATION=-
MFRTIILALLLLEIHSFVTPQTKTLSSTAIYRRSQIIVTKANNEEEWLQNYDGKFTIKQRLREEVESPFRKVRFFFYVSSAGSAALALYFSALSTLKAYTGGFADAPPLEDALQNSAINLAGTVVFALLAFREYQAGEKNLARIAQGGLLARLAVKTATAENEIKRMTEYRRNSRVIIAAGGKDYISRLALSLTSNQLKDENIFPKALSDVDVIVVPVLLESDGGKTASVGDTSKSWIDTVAGEDDRDFDINKANDIISFPVGNAAWSDYLKPELETAVKQKIDFMEKGVNIIVKKNGKILRRSTGLPKWADLIQTMEVMDGSKFGMPGDSEKYD